jgi:hypothetical protein
LAWARDEMKRKRITETGETLRTQLAPLLPHLRLACLSASDMASQVAPTNILLPEQLLALFSYVATAAAEKKSGAKVEKKEEKKGEKKSEGVRIGGFLATPRKGISEGFTWDPEKKAHTLTLSNENRTLTGPVSSEAVSYIHTFIHSYIHTSHRQSLKNTVHTDEYLLHVCVCVCVCVCMYVCMYYVCMYVCMCVCCVVLCGMSVLVKNS